MDELGIIIFIVCIFAALNDVLFEAPRRRQMEKTLQQKLTSHDWCEINGRRYRRSK